jgi:hypothetical protein
MILNYFLMMATRLKEELDKQNKMKCSSTTNVSVISNLFTRTNPAGGSGLGL